MNDLPFNWLVLGIVGTLVIGGVLRLLIRGLFSMPEPQVDDD